MFSFVFVWKVPSHYGRYGGGTDAERGKKGLENLSL